MDTTNTAAAASAADVAATTKAKQLDFKILVIKTYTNGIMKKQQKQKKR